MRSPVKPGQLIADKYRVEVVLGQGGMGVVVAALHVHLGHRVAIKFLLPGALVNASTMARFEREARAVVALQSDHVSRVFDVGRLDDGAPYIVMELLQGTDLAEVVRTRGRLAPHEAVGYVLQACDAIAEAHGLGIVHRDIKPANLFLAQRPKRAPVVKVLDFGISKVSEVGDGPQDLTGTKDVVGSPVYMSPEQLRGAKKVDARSDIWSLGVTLYELVTGTLPFEGGTLAELSANILTMPAPDARASGRDHVPVGLAEVVARCLAKAPEARFPSVEALMLALEPFRDEAPATSPLAVTSPPSQLGVADTQPAMPAAFRTGRIATAASLPPVVTEEPPIAPGNVVPPPARFSARVRLASVGVALLVGGAGIGVTLRGGGSAPAGSVPAPSLTASSADTRTPTTPSASGALTVVTAADPATTTPSVESRGPTPLPSAPRAPQPARPSSSTPHAPASAPLPVPSTPAPSATSRSPMKVTIQ